MTENEINLYLKEILNTMNDGLLLVRPDGTIMLVNEALSRITGYSREELMNSRCTMLGCDECERSRAEGRQHWCRLFSTRQLHRKDCHFTRKDGTYVHVLKNASLLRDDEGNVLGTVETITDISELDRKEQEIRELAMRLGPERGFHGMLGESAAMRRVFGLLEKAAASDAPVILYGESGTGKELAARAIHELGERSGGPFVQINCAAFNESLLESEIFGHVKGAFTGAYRHRTGRFEEAAGGDVFLDEIGDVPLSVQVKLLRVLETKIFERVGDNRPLELDARIIAATNQDLRALSAQGRFREDLYFRLHVIPIHLPPLRERAEDIPLLVEHFVRRAARTAGKDIAGPTPEALAMLMRYGWPGNVRELKSAVDYAFVVCEDAHILPEHLPPQIVGEPTCPPAPAAAADSAAQPGGHNPMPEEQARLMAALRQSGGNKSEAARILGVSRMTVLNRMRKYGVDLKRVITT